MLWWQVIEDKGPLPSLTLMRADPLGAGACMVGQVIPSAAAPVLMKSRIGVNRIVAMLSGEQLPRIC